MRVAILPTGRMEWDALQVALGRLFPRHEFYSIPAKSEVASNESVGFPAPSFTSCDVTLLQGRSNNADKLIRRAIGEAISDRTRSGADLVVVIDDVEVDNRKHVSAVTGVVREAADRHLATLVHDARLQRRHASTLRERVSFHVAKPMIESWLFPDPHALGLAGVRPGTFVGNNPNVDPEEFEALDALYQLDDGTGCLCWQGLPDRTAEQHRKKSKSRPQWLKADPNRHIHPKAYLSWLCLDPAEPTCTRYAETGSGAAALKAIDWTLLFEDPSRATFARALLADVADALHEPDPFPGHRAPETAHDHLPSAPLLRNL